MTSEMFEKLNAELKNALLSHDEIKKSALRSLLSDVKNKTVNAGVDITDDSVTSCAAKCVKMRLESIAQFKAGGRDDLASREEAELEILRGFAPSVLTEAETRALVDKLIADGARDLGSIMRSLPKNADKKYASAYARQALSA